MLQSVDTEVSTADSDETRARLFQMMSATSVKTDSFVELPGFSESSHHHRHRGSSDTDDEDDEDEESTNNTDTVDCAVRKNDQKYIFQICMEEIVDKKQFPGPCEHYFCEKCIDIWLKSCASQKSLPTCPLCRKYDVDFRQRLRSLSNRLLFRGDSEYDNLLTGATTAGYVATNPCLCLFFISGMIALSVCIVGGWSAFSPEVSIGRLPENRGWGFTYQSE
jgi:hypothetical protein